MRGARVWRWQWWCVVGMCCWALAGASAGRVDAEQSQAAAGSRRGAAGTLVVGWSHSCVVRAGGEQVCWGNNSAGQLGLGDASNRGDGPGEVAALGGINLGGGRTAVAIGAGVVHTCALLDTGAIKCWGSGSSGQLGYGDTSNRGDGPGEMGDSLPVVALGRSAVAVSTRTSHTCAIVDTGAVKCWGANGNGQLGYGDTSDRGDNPGEMGDALPAVDLGTGRTAVAISAGNGHTCAILDNGAVKCWGLGSLGRLGYGDTSNRGDGPGEMGDSLPMVDLGGGRTAVAISAGGGHTCAILDNGAVKCWGYAFSGQLGYGDTNNRGDVAAEMGDALPTVDLGAGRTAVAISTGNAHTCAILETGAVKCWGSGADGRLGYGDANGRGDGAAEMGDFLPPVNLGPGRTALAISTGQRHTCAALDTGAATCWGYAFSGQLGYGNVNDQGDAPGELPTPNVPFTGLIAAMPSPPSPPTGVSAIGGPASYTVSWIAPGDDGGSPITSYEVQRSADGVAWSAAGSTGGAQTTWSAAATPGEQFRLRIAARNAAGLSPPSAASTPITIEAIPPLPAVPPIVTLDPARLLDSRPSGQTVDGQSRPGTALGAGAVIEVPIAGRGGVPLDAPTALLNVTAVGPAAAGYASVYPCGVPPNASNLNYQPGQDIPNAVATKLSPTGTVCIYTSATAHFLIDVTGYSPAGAGLTPIDPVRLLDSRPGGQTIDGLQQRSAVVTAGEVIEVPIAGRSGIPSDAATALLNVTAVGAAAAGYASVYPCGAPPNASNLNYRAGQDIPNAVITKLSPTGTVCVFTSATAHFLIDATGHVPPGSALIPLDPVRLLDTRPGGQTTDGLHLPGAVVAGGGVIEVPIAGRGGVPASAATALLNVTAVGPSAAGFASVYPCGPPPNASNLNYQPGQDIPNAVVTKLSASGTVCIYTSATTHVLVDITGYL